MGNHVYSDFELLVACKYNQGLGQRKIWDICSYNTIYLWALCNLHVAQGKLPPLAPLNAAFLTCDVITHNIFAVKINPGLIIYLLKFLIACFIMNCT